LRDQHSVEGSLWSGAVSTAKACQALNGELFVAFIKYSPSHFPGIDRESSRLLPFDDELSQRLAVLKT